MNKYKNNGIESQELFDLKRRKAVIDVLDKRILELQNKLLDKLDVLSNYPKDSILFQNEMKTVKKLQMQHKMLYEERQKRFINLKKDVQILKNEISKREKEEKKIEQEQPKIDINKEKEPIISPKTTVDKNAKKQLNGKEEKTLEQKIIELERESLLQQQIKKNSNLQKGKKYVFDLNIGRNTAKLSNYNGKIVKGSYDKISKIKDEFLKEQIKNYKKQNKKARIRNVDMTFLNLLQVVDRNNGENSLVNDYLNVINGDIIDKNTFYNSLSSLNDKIEINYSFDSNAKWFSNMKEKRIARKANRMGIVNSLTGITEKNILEKMLDRMRKQPMTLVEGQQEDLQFDNESNYNQMNKKDNSLEKYRSTENVNEQLKRVVEDRNNSKPQINQNVMDENNDIIK